MRKRTGNVLLFGMVILMIFLMPGKAHAYVLNQQYVPFRATYYVMRDAEPFRANIDYTKQWNYQGARVFVKEMDEGYINIYQNYTDEDNGALAVTYYVNERQSDIRYYRAFKKASAAERNETVVHEVGHALGLSHTQPKNNKISVMRAFGFNGKAYPLADDKAGMRAKY